MENFTQRRRLLKQMYREPAYPMIVVAKCAAGLAIVLILSLLTIVPEGRRLAQPAGTSASDVAQAEPVRSEAHRKVSDEGR